MLKSEFGDRLDDRKIRVEPDPEHPTIGDVEQDLQNFQIDENPQGRAAVAIPEQTQQLPGTQQLQLPRPDPAFFRTPFSAKPSVKTSIRKMRDRSLVEGALLAGQDATGVRVAVVVRQSA